jgi:putative peptide zinc metalloprotease protein
VAASFEVQPRGADSVYVEVAGTLREVLVRSGPVTAGQPIAQLADVDGELALARLVAQRAEIAARIDAIRQRAHTDDSALLELAQTEEAFAVLDRQVARLEAERARLTIRAPRDGVVVPAPQRPKPLGERVQLAGWSGRPLAASNVGAYLEEGTLLCRVAQPGALEAVLAIDQTELDFVRPGQRVDLLLVSRPGEMRPVKIERIAEANMEIAPERLAAHAGGQLATRNDPHGAARPLSVVYQASAPLDDPEGDILVGTTGVARIHAGWQSLGRRLWRAACRTFRFEM